METKKLLVKNSLIKNNSGVATVDYLFSFILVGGFSFLILALSMTLTMVEIVQYMTFASARHHYAGHLNPQSQFDSGAAKFQQLVAHPTVQPLFENGWFELDGNTLSIGTNIPGSRQDLSGYQQQEDQNLFHGTVVWFSSKVLEFNVPFFGSTVMQDEDRGDLGFGANIGSYLGRETSHEECENFMIDRWEAIRNLDTGSNAPYAQAEGGNLYIPIYDNGC